MATSALILFRTVLKLKAESKKKVRGHRVRQTLDKLPYHCADSADGRLIKNMYGKLNFYHIQDVLISRWTPPLKGQYREMVFWLKPSLMM